jgi:hypothetical protein
MTYNFNSSKTNLKKRTLGLESLENREMLSVNPLALATDAPVAVQTDQQFGTEADATLTPSAITHTTATVTIGDTVLVTLGLNDVGYGLQYREKTQSAADGWVDTGASAVTMSANGTTASGDLTANLTSLEAGKTYEFRIVLFSEKSTGTDSGMTNPVAAVGTLTTAAAPTYTSSFDASTGTLTVNFTGLVNGVTYTASASAAQGTGSTAPGAVTVNQTALTTVSGTTASITITTASEALVDGNTVTLNLKQGSVDLISAGVINVSATQPGDISVVQGVSVTGLTTGAATITFPKVAKVGKGDGTAADNHAAAKAYRVFVDGQDAALAGYTTEYTAAKGTTKNSVTLVGLDPNTQYTITYTAYSDPAAATALGTFATGVTLGTFTTLALDPLASEMTIGQPTDLKTAGKDAQVDVTWKAPLNYTGGYELTFKDVANPSVNHFTVTVAAGAKYSAKFGASFDGTTATLKGGDRYSVTIKANGAAAAALETTTYFKAAKGTDGQDGKPTATSALGVPASGLVEVLAGSKASSGIGGTVNVKLASGQTDVTGAVGYWVKVGPATAAGVAISTPLANAAAAITAGYTYVTAAQLTAAGVDIVTTSFGAATNVSAFIYAADAAGTISTTGWEEGSTNGSAARTNIVTDADKASVTLLKKGTTADDSILLEWTAPTTTTFDSTYNVEAYEVYVSRGSSGAWTYFGEAVVNTNQLSITGLEAGTDYYFQVVTRTTNGSGDFKIGVPTVNTAAFKTTGSAATGKNDVAATVTAVYDRAAGTVKVDITMDTGKSADNFVIVLRDANKAILATEQIAGSVLTHTFSSVDNLAKGSYTVEVWSAKASGTLASSAKTFTVKVDEYSVATAKAKETGFNGTKVNIVDKKGTAADFYYVEITKTVDAKGKPDWNTAIVEKVAASNNTAIKGKDGYDYTIAAKLDPGAQYFVRIVKADVDVAITSNAWTSGAGGKDWTDAATVVYGKEAKFKTKAIALATVGKPGFGIDSSYNMMLKTVGQTVLSTQKAADNPFATGKDFDGATFAYKLVVSFDSKVDKGTGLLLGSKTISVNPTIAPWTNGGKLTTPIVDGQYTLEVPITAVGGIFDELGANASAADFAKTVKNLNFQLITTVTYGTSPVSFDSISKVGKVALPKWFV